MDLKRFRKALAAGAGAATSAVITALVNGDQPVSGEGWAALIGGSIGLGVLTAAVVYRARNEGPGIVPGVGSERGSRLYPGS